MRDTAIQIRLAKTTDAPDVSDLYAEIVQETAISFESRSPSHEQAAIWMISTMKRHPWLIADIEGKFAGFAYAGDHGRHPAYRWTCDTSVFVHPDHRGKGVGEALYRELIHYMVRLGFASALASITLPNPASIRLHEKLGFNSVGIMEKVGYKLGSWHDVGWWRLTLQDLGDPPPEPLILPYLHKKK